MRILVHKLYRWCKSHQYHTKILGFIPCWVTCIALLTGIQEGWCAPPPRHLALGRRRLAADCGTPPRHWPRRPWHAARGTPHRARLSGSEGRGA